jgi:hypothetical protein
MPDEPSPDRSAGDILEIDRPQRHAVRQHAAVGADREAGDVSAVTDLADHHA